MQQVFQRGSSAIGAGRNESMKQTIKEIIFGIGSNASFRAWRLGLIRCASVITILNIHRVAPDDGSAHRPLDPKLFESTIQFLRRHFEIYTFAGARDSFSSKPRAILSFDDGYKHFIDHAVPILDKYGVACNQNVIPSCIETALPPLSVLAQDFVGNAACELLARLEIPGFGRQVEKQSGNELSRFLKNRSQQSQSALAAKILPQLLPLPAWRERTGE